jgi:hypothetical protein
LWAEQADALAPEDLRARGVIFTEENLDVHYVRPKEKFKISRLGINLDLEDFESTFELRRVPSWELQGLSNLIDLSLYASKNKPAK